jgi:uncharacterized protein with HEPN domain
MNKAIRVPDYLGHILQTIERIERYTRDVDVTHSSRQVRCFKMRLFATSK